VLIKIPYSKVSIRLSNNLTLSSNSFNCFGFACWGTRAGGGVEMGVGADLVLIMYGVVLMEHFEARSRSRKAVDSDIDRGGREEIVEANGSRKMTMKGS
jgi:hypothetical protein